ncbi:MAG TPA: TonB family protein [Candidatus Polarisedimenticolia bacterium]|jgi:peptidyl-prolyl cis-trans isomerase B (cyclophilin B)|nr:TonB family protein [Candidatus Polarisedimenticolia bacterium]
MRWIVSACMLVACGATAAHASTEEVAVLTTPQGEIVWRFLDGDAPGHTAYVRDLIHRGFYDGTTFHRVIPHFVVQGGDPNSKNADRSDDGEGEGDLRLKAEFSTALHYRPGTVGMARDADPDSGSCQFFIALEDLPRLDGRYTIFGEVVAGLDVARRIADLPRDLNDNPLDSVRVTARLEKRKVPDGVVSRRPGGASGEVLTGPGKPKPYDPGNLLWKPPEIEPAAPQGGRASGETSRLELAVAEDGAVLDVRFPEVFTPGAARLRKAALGWRFRPATYAGKPRKVRFEIGSDGSGLARPPGGGAPVELQDGIAPPRPAPRVVLPPGRKPPAKGPRLRLTIDETGQVADAALQSGCGEADLDAAAVEAALALSFKPAARPAPGGGDPRPIAVYLDVEARFVETPPR